MSDKRTHKRRIFSFFKRVVCPLNMKANPNIKANWFWPGVDCMHCLKKK